MPELTCQKKQTVVLNIGYGRHAPKITFPLRGFVSLFFVLLVVAVVLLVVVVVLLADSKSMSSVMTASEMDQKG